MQPPDRGRRLRLSAGTMAGTMGRVCCADKKAALPLTPERRVGQRFCCSCRIAMQLGIYKTVQETNIVFPERFFIQVLISIYLIII